MRTPGRSGKRLFMGGKKIPPSAGAVPVASLGGRSMKAISVQQPWAWLIVAGLKKVENRSWPTDHRGRMAIHASSRLALKSWSDILEPDGNEPLAVDETVGSEDGVILPALSNLPLSAIVGTVEGWTCPFFARLDKS
jgi:hypothetical protein